MIASGQLRLMSSFFIIITDIQLRMPEVDKLMLKYAGKGGTIGISEFFEVVSTLTTISGLYNYSKSLSDTSIAGVYTMLNPG